LGDDFLWRYCNVNKMYCHTRNVNIIIFISHSCSSTLKKQRFKALTENKKESIELNWKKSFLFLLCFLISILYAYLFIKRKHKKTLWNAFMLLIYTFFYYIRGCVCCVQWESRIEKWRRRWRRSELVEGIKYLFWT